MCQIKTNLLFWKIFADLQKFFLCYCSASILIHALEHLGCHFAKRVWIFLDFPKPSQGVSPPPWTLQRKAGHHNRDPSVWRNPGLLPWNIMHGERILKNHCKKVQLAQKIEFKLINENAKAWKLTWTKTKKTDVDENTKTWKLAWMKT